MQNGDTLSNVDLTDMAKKHKKATVSVLLDNWRAAGTWLYSKEYFTNPELPIVPYRPAGLFWFDTGTPERLAEAKKFFE